ncbi:hypothetical protein AC1031_009243 [Aphanomyces cochlioides]|nr:hypothetical protein AC1031_009243 [Aphanomyces cochlioides]
MIVPTEPVDKLPAPQSPVGYTRMQSILARLAVLGLHVGLLVVSVLTPAMLDQLFWPHFNRTGYQAFLIDLINLQHDATNHGTVDLYAISVIKSYAAADIELDFNSGYARRVFFSDLNKPLQSIRNTDLSMVSSIYANYCWVDFSRQWSMAHSDTRATRCQARYADNAAVYLETLRRNTNWAEFVASIHDKWCYSMLKLLVKDLMSRE